MRAMTTIGSRILLGGLFCTSISCGGGSSGGGGSITAPGGTGGSSAATQISIVSGNNQSGSVGGSLSSSLAVKVTNAQGAGVAGVAVSFAAATGGGTVNPSSVATDGNGNASTVWTLGSASGAQTVTAVSTGLTGSPQTFTATATALVAAGAPASLVIVSGNNQMGALRAILAQPLVVAVKDANGVGVPGINVNFQTGGDAQFVGGQPGSGKPTSSLIAVTTNSSGQASAQFTLGSGEGIYGVAAELPSNVLASAVVYFSASTTGVDPARIATLAVGPGPQGVTVNATTNRIYTGNTNVTFGCAFVNETSTQRLGIQNFTPGSFSVIDGTSNQVTTLATTNGPIYATANPATNRVYVAGTSVLEVWDGSTNSRLAITGLTGGLHQVAVNPNRNEIWVNATDSRTVKLLDGATNQQIATVSTGKEGPHGIAINTVTNRIYTTDLAANSVTVIDGATRQIITSISIPTPALGIAVNSVTNKVYVSSGGFGAFLHVIDGATNTLVTSVPAGNRQFLEVEVDEVRNRVFVASNTMPFAVLVFNGVTNTFTETHPVGRCPFGSAYNPVTNRLYVTSYTDNTVLVLDASKMP